MMKNKFAGILPDFVTGYKGNKIVICFKIE